VYFSANSSSTANASGVFYVGVGVDLADPITLQQLGALDPACLGSAGATCRARVEVGVQIHTHSLACRYWDTQLQQWTSAGCEAGVHATTLCGVPLVFRIVFSCKNMNPQLLAHLLLHNSDITTVPAQTT